MRTLLRWLARLLLIVAAVAVIAVVCLRLFVHEPRPQGKEGKEADALARRIEAAVNVAAWREVSALRWRFAGRHRHLWDRRRKLVSVRWGDKEVLYRLADRRGVALHGGREVSGVLRAELIADAHRRFINDSFWLQPFSKLFDAGVSRRLLPPRSPEGRPRLLITFASGGVTPGDSYAIEVDEAGRPSRWQMWVKILPIGGLAASWEGWRPLPGGALIATRHRALLDIEIDELQSAESAAALTTSGRDPFERLGPLLGSGEPSSRPASRAASRPASRAVIAPDR